jgi:hypothetical protein
VVLALPVVAAVGIALALGGRLTRLAEFRLRSIWLFYLGFALQVVAFPFTFLPWQTGDTTATALWVASYCVLVAAAIRNRRIAGVLVVAVGMCSNLVAVLANGGHMPVRPEAMIAAGENYTVQANSAALEQPHLPWLIDRWAAPDWVPMANVYSVGDVIIALGAMTIVLVAMGVSAPRPLRRRRFVEP